MCSTFLVSVRTVAAALWTICSCTWGFLFHIVTAVQCGNDWTMWRMNPLQSELYIFTPADGRTVAVVSEEVQSDCPRLTQPADLSVSKRNMAAAQVLQSSPDTVDSDLRRPPSFSPLPSFPRLSPLPVLCVINCEPPPPDLNALHKIGTNKLRGQPAVKDSPSFFLYKCLLPLSSFSPFAEHCTGVCVCVCACVLGDILWRRNDCGQLWARRSKAILSLRCPSDWNSSPGLIIQPVCADFVEGW